MTRTDIIRGPAVVQYGTAAILNGSGGAAKKLCTFYSAGDIEVSIELETSPVDTSQYGKIDERVLNRKVEVKLQPTGLFQNLAASFTDRSEYIWPHLGAALGSRLFASTALTEKQLRIWTINDGQIYIFNSAAVLSMPSFNCSPSRIICGDMTFACLQPLGSSDELQDWSVATANKNIYTVTPLAFSATDIGLSTSDILQDVYSVDWGSVTGFDHSVTPICTIDGFTVEFATSWDPVECDSKGIIDYSLSSIEASCKFKPLNISVTNVLAALKMQGAGVVRGQSLSGLNSSNLIISGSAVDKPKVTIYGAQHKTAGLGFGLTTPNVGELTFVATRTMTDGVLSDLAAIGLVTA